MVLGEMIAVEARAIVSLGEGQPVGIELAERHARVVDVVEDAEFHATAPSHARALRVRSSKRLPTCRRI